MQRRGLGPLGRAQVGVAAGQGQPVGVPHGGAADHPDVDGQVGHHAADHGELLEVLLAEIGRAPPDYPEQLGHHRGHALHVAGAGRPLQRLAQAGHRDGGDRRGREHLGRRRGEHHVGAGRGARLHIPVRGPGVSLEILAGAELQRVDEHRHHHHVVVAAGPLDQRPVPGVQRPHGGHEAHPGPPGPVLPEPVPQLADPLDHPKPGQERTPLTSGVQLSVTSGPRR